MDEIREDEFVETADPVETEVNEQINDDEGSSIGSKVILGLGAVAIGAAGGWAAKKLGPKIKTFTDKKKLEHLQRKQERLAAKQASTQVKINQMMKDPKPDSGKKEE